MKSFSTLLLLSAWSLVTSRAAAEAPCCLCESCEDVPSENADVITVSPFGAPEGTTCTDLARDVLDLIGESDMCSSIVSNYRSGCCIVSPLEHLLEEEDSTVSSFLRGARLLWSSNRSSTRTSSRYGSRTRTSSASSGGNGGCTYSPVGVRFNTLGGNFGFSICKNGRAPTGIAGATIMDPNEGRKFSGSCQQINQQALNGYMSNNMCAICRLRLDAVCCSNPENTASSLYSSWRGVGTGNN